MFRKNTAGQFVHFQGVDSTTGGIKSGVTWTVRRCLDGTFAAATGTVTEDGTTGWYKLALSQADTNGNNCGFNATGTGAVPQTINIVTTACDPTSTAFGLSLAKTTNITGFNDIAATAVVSAGAITTSGGAVSTVTAVTGAVGSVTAAVTVGTNNDKTGYGLSAAAVQAIWDALTTALTTVGSIGKKLADWVIGTTQTGDSFARLGAPAGASVSADIAAVKADTAAILDDTGTAGVIVAAGSKTGYSLTATTGLGNQTADITGSLSGSVGSVTGAVSLTAGAVDAIWDEATAGHTTAGTTGKSLIDAGSAGDPWGTALPGAYGAGTAGKIIGDNLNATVSSRASQSALDTLDDYVDTEVAAIKAKTDSLTFTVAGQVDANIQSVNDVTVTGNGQPGTEWGP